MNTMTGMMTAATRRVSHRTIRRERNWVVIVDLGDQWLARQLQRSLDLGEFFNECLVILIGFSHSVAPREGSRLRSTLASPTSLDDGSGRPRAPG